MDICPICGSINVRKKITAEIFKYKNHKITIHDYEQYYCVNCGEGFPTNNTLKRSDKLLKEAREKIDNKKGN